MRVDVISKTYGDFQEEKLVPLGAPVSFGPHGQSHSQFDNPNNCKMNVADVPVVDGVRIDIERGPVFEGNRLVAKITGAGAKFQNYGPPAHFGWCGDVRLASNIGFDSTETAGQFQLGRSVTIPDPAHDVSVTITFLATPAQ
ncbi:hypothetical protein PQQ52_02350 [Paraburkholderia sediminicola]|uniref:hypothetical protein n=1 Tax=Paraburkholderia sediminicola TaxID=458836 RepID=UPI0038B81957